MVNFPYRDGNLARATIRGATFAAPRFAESAGRLVVFFVVIRKPAIIAGSLLYSAARTGLT
jgi:hypothetical protein